MKKSILLSACLAVAIFAMTSPASAAIRWGFGNPWPDTITAGHPDGWGTFNMSFDNVPPDLTLAKGTVGNLAGTPYGLTYYGTGVATSELAVDKFLYLETTDIQGDLKVRISGPSDADVFNLTTALISHSGATDPRDPTGNVLFNPGQYVFDLTQWHPAASYSNIQVELVAEGGTGKSFTAKNIFISDTNPLAAVPEVSSWLMLSMGLGMVGLMRRKFKK